MNPTERSPKSVRLKGLQRLLLWLAVFALGMTVPLVILPRLGYQLTPLSMIPFALPGAYALSGVVEMVTGLSFIETATRWDQLKGWQRGVLGTFIVLVAGIVIICGFALFSAN